MSILDRNLQNIQNLDIAKKVFFYSGRASKAFNGGVKGLPSSFVATNFFLSFTLVLKKTETDFEKEFPPPPIFFLLLKIQIFGKCCYKLLFETPLF